MGLPPGLLCGASLPPSPRGAVRDQPAGREPPRSRLATLWFHQQPLGVTVASATSDRQGQGRGPGDRGSLPPILTPAGQGTGAVSARADTVSAASPQAPRVRPRVAAWESGPEAGAERPVQNPTPASPSAAGLLPETSVLYLLLLPANAPPALASEPGKRLRGSCRMPGGISVLARRAAGSGHAGSERTRLPARLRLGASSAHRATRPLPPLCPPPEPRGAPQR